MMSNGNSGDDDGDSADYDDCNSDSEDKHLHAPGETCIEWHEWR